MCIGYPNHDPDIKSRLPLEVIFKTDGYNTTGDADKIENKMLK